MFLALVHALVLAVQGPVIGQKINGPLSVPGAGVTYGAVLTEGGEFAVYVALQDSSTLGVYATELAPGYANQRLHLFSAGAIGSFVPAEPSGIDVLFRPDGVLLAVSADGHAPAVTLSGPGHYVPLFGARVVPDGTRALYRDSAASELYSVRLDGTEAPLHLAGPPAGSPKVSANGVVVFPAASPGAGYEYFATTVTGGPVVSLTRGPLPVPQNTSPDYDLTPDGSHLVFLAKTGTSRYELFGVPTDASVPPFRLHAPLLDDESVGVYFGPNGGSFGHSPRFVIGPDGKSVVFIALLERPDPVFHVRVSRLDVARARAVASVQPPRAGRALGRTLASFPWPYNPSDDGYSLGNLAVDPSGQWVVYQTITDGDLVDARGRLYSVRIAGDGPPVELTSGVVGAGGGLPMPTYELASSRISPDGSRVVFRSRETSAGLLYFYSAPIDGSAVAVQLTTIGIGSLIKFALEGDRLVYLTGTARRELWQVPILGGTPPARLNGPLVAGGNVIEFDSLPGKVIYLADEDTDNVNELYYSTFP